MGKRWELELVTLETEDGVALDGAWYVPAGSVTRRGAAVLVVHGLTWNFYRGPSRWLPPALAESGYPALALNMRDHDRDEVKDFELSYRDLAAGIGFLEREGPGEVVLLGHGYACNKLLCYAALSGDGRAFRRVLTTLGAIASYRPEIWENVLASAAGMRGEGIVIQGAIDPLIAVKERAEELVWAARSAKMDVVMLEGGDHYFNGRHEALAECVLEWLGRSGAHGA